MAVLSDEKIIERIKDPDDEFKITPIFDWEKQVSSSSVDLRLDNQFIIIPRTSFSSINPVERTRIETTISRYQKKITIPYGEKFVLHPNELVLGSTIEYMSFPDDLMAYVIGRSSWGRLGLIIATATAINPGFKGNLTLELVNAGNVPIELYPGVRIAQLKIHGLSKYEDKKNVIEKDVEENKFEKKDKGKYHLQIGPGFSKIYDDPELEYLKIPKYNIIIGITGHKGSGKSVFTSFLVEDKLYNYFSLSHIVRRKYSQEYNNKPVREDLQNFGDHLRKIHGANYLARQIIKEIKNANLDSDSCILIDGIRNPAEVKFLKSIPNFHLIGIDATKEKIKHNLKNKGYLITNKKFEKKAMQLDKDELASYMSMDQFEKAYRRDCGLSYEPEKKEYGQNIAECLRLIPDGNITKIDKNTTVIESLNQFKKIIKRLE
jgi:dCTP deaminase